MSLETMVRPFIDFYTKLNVIPTHQDIADLQNHFDRRRGLYLQLGIPPTFIRNLRVLEFGPGTGQNALYTASLKPLSYTLVDGNEKSIEVTNKVLSRYSGESSIKIIKDDILAFKSEEQYDLVLCEGLISTQLDPSRFLQHVSSFVSPGGVLAITCMDYVAQLSEVIRRYMAFYEINPDREVNERIFKLTSFFKPHFEQLPGMSRFHEEWVIDNIIHPWHGPLFGISEAIQTLAGSYVVLGSSPNFLCDWRWYKSIVGEEISSVIGAERSYWRNVHSFLDHRIVMPERSEEDNKQLFVICRQIFENIIDQERNGEKYHMKKLAEDLTGVISLIKLYDNRVSQALREVVDSLTSYSGRWPTFTEFSALWGRGQQYMSFLRL